MDGREIEAQSERQGTSKWETEKGSSLTFLVEEFMVASAVRGYLLSAI